MAIDPDAKYGNTSPVLNCGAAYGVPPEVVYPLADALLHGRFGYWYEQAQKWVTVNMWDADEEAFVKDLLQVVNRARA